MQEDKPKIGVLGGTFDPPHLGHLRLAEAALRELSLDEVLLIPASRNPLKTTRPLAAAAHRMEMTRRLIEKSPGLAISDLEIRRGGPSFTYETLDELQAVRPGEYWLILGSDSFRTIRSWRNPEKVLRLARLAVALRPPQSEVELFRGVPDEVRARIDLLPMPPQEISSTEVRDRLAIGKPTNPWLPPAVLTYIQEQKLYRDL